MPVSPKNRNLAIIVAAVVLVAGAGIATAAWYNAKDEAPAAKPAVHTTSRENINWNPPANPPAAPVQQVSNCDDSNVVGMVAGGALGGIAGSQVGKGNGKTAATIGGAVGGAYLGKQYIPTKNVTCR